MTPDDEKRIRLTLAKHAGRDLQAYIASQHDIRLLLAALDAARAERDRMERQRDESRDLYEKMMVAIHDAAGCERNGAAGILSWIHEARAERDEARKVATLAVRCHLSPSDDVRARGFREAMAAVDGWEVE